MPPGVDPQASYFEITQAHKRLRQSLARAYGRHEWSAVLEEQPGRRVAHLHVLMRGLKIRQLDLRRAALASGFGKATDIRPAHADHVRYMTKSLSLAGAVRLPAYARRVRTSKGWATRPRPSSPPPSNDVVWWIANAPPRTAEFLRANGYVVDFVATGYPSRRPASLPVRWWPAGSRRFTTPYPFALPRAA